MPRKARHRHLQQRESGVLAERKAPEYRLADLPEASYHVEHENIVGEIAGAARRLGDQPFTETRPHTVRGGARGAGARAHRRQPHEVLP